MERTKLYKLIIAALVIINVGILVFFYAGRPPHGRQKPPSLITELGIEGAKTKIINQLEKEHHAKKRELMKIDFELHQELFSKIGTDEDVSAIQEKIRNNFAEIEKITYDFFHDVAEHCTPEQAVKLRETINFAFNQMQQGPN